MILIADSGSTKTEWCLLKDRTPVLTIKTEGYNPYFVDTTYIIRSLRSHFTNENQNRSISKIYFYGSGCFPETASIVSNALSQIFLNAVSYVELDLLAAARSLLGMSSGFAAILGTGTNTCLYNGREIIQNIDSLGFILGDEGSGTHIGKKILSHFIRGYMPAKVQELLLDEYPLTKENIFQEVYTNRFANRFCSQFTKFASHYITLPYINDLVENCFKEFFENLICKYDKYDQYTFNCVGSVGFIFQKQLRNVSAEFGMKTEVITQSPLEGLLEYHKNYS